MTLNSLVRMRVILFFLVSALLYGQTLIAGCLRLAQLDHGKTDLRPWLQGVDAVLMLAAIVIFVFSFIRITRRDGVLCYDPANPYWRLMREIYGEEWKESMSLCKSYWLTVWMIFLPTVAIVLIACVLIYAVPEMIRSFIATPWPEIWQGVGILCGTLIGSACLIGLVYWLSTKTPWIKWVGLAMLIAGIVTLTVIVPIAEIAKDRNVPVSSATGIYSAWAGVVIVGVAVIGGLVYGAFKFIPWLSNTWLGNVLAAFKQRMCPVLMACPCGSQQPLPFPQN